MSASGCCSKWAARLVSRSAIWRLSSAMMPTAARVVAPERGAHRWGAASCSERSAACTWRARSAILRWRPPRLSADWIAGRSSRAPCSGGGAAPVRPARRRGPGHRRPPARPGSTHAARYAARWCGGYATRSNSDAPGQHLDRLGVSAVASDQAMVVPIGAHRSASSLASEASDLAPDTWWRSR